LIEQGKQEKSPKKRLMITAKVSRQLYDSERAQIDIFQGASVLAPEFKELQKEMEQRRYLLMVNHAAEPVQGADFVALPDTLLSTAFRHFCVSPTNY
jgi:hypothetical protein